MTGAARRPPGTSLPEWIDASGRAHAIAGMGDAHLVNALPFARRRIEAAIDVVGDACVFAGGVAGDAACRAVDGAVAEAERDVTAAVAVHDAMAAEIASRGLAGGTGP